MVGDHRYFGLNDHHDRPGIRQPQRLGSVPGHSRGLDDNRPPRGIFDRTGQ
jgi:hypothetical protein